MPASVPDGLSVGQDIVTRQDDQAVVPKHQRPTMRDVAALAGVALKTVSRVVNNEASVSDAISTRVRSAIRSLNYQPDLRAGSLRRTNNLTATVGLIVGSVANPFSGAIHRAVEDAASKRGVAVFAASLDDDANREMRVVGELLRHRVDGMILTTVARSQAYLAAEQAYGTPFVFVDRVPSGIEADAVVSDNSVGAENATRHLIEHGHRRIAYLGDREDIQSAHERLKGFMKALGAAGIPTSSVSAVPNLHDEFSAFEATVRVITMENPPTAIFSSQNLVTAGVIRALRQVGRQHEIALVGFDDVPFADLLDPGVTVVAQHPQRIGEVAAERLFARLDGNEDPPKRFVVETTLIPRGSGEIRPSELD